MYTDIKLLIKFPTRNRPDKFFNVLKKYIEMADNPQKIAFLITMDVDDPYMNNNTVINKLNDIKKIVKLVFFYGKNKTKIEAVNADMEKVTGWDIVLLASDDMVPIVKGYDNVIRKDMDEHFKDKSGCLWYSDGGQNNICTLSILGKAYYNRFNYIYNPEYASLWCDNEHTDVITQLKKVYKSSQVIIEHQHPVYQKTKYDQLYVRNESYFNIDQKVYERRKSKNFDLPFPTNQKISDTELFHSKYDESTKTLIGTHHSGFYSCINCLRISLYKLISKGIIPEKISLEDSLHWYKNSKKQDLYQLLYKTDTSKLSTLNTNFNFEIFCPTERKHDMLDLENFNRIENVYFQPSDNVDKVIKILEKKYLIDYNKTIAVLYRGNDKWKETKLSPVEDWIKVIESKYQEGDKIFIQTDEENAKNKFINHFKDRCFYMEEMIFGNSHNTNIRPANNKEIWAISFESVMRIISKCRYIINHSGNCAMVPVIYRGHLKGNIQFYNHEIFEYE